MPNQSPGLRFDIYERVHLPEDVVGIKELDVIELVPQIELEVDGDQAVLQGNLVLSGSYTGNRNDEPSQPLYHLIPVQITLPMNRVQKLDLVSIHVENFDIDLLSARSIHVTGVLQLDGVADQGEIVFVENLETRKSDITHNEPEDAEQLEEPEQQEQLKEDEDVTQVLLEEGYEELLDAHEDSQEQVEQPEQIDESFVELVEENIAGPEDGGTQLFTVKLNPSSAKPAEHSVEETQKLTSEQLEWKKLFMREGEGNSFRRLKLCIVQKEDSIESIAQKYSLNPREIVLYNRLSDQNVTEGQVIYIPS